MDAAMYKALAGVIETRRVRGRPGARASGDNLLPLYHATGSV